MNMNIADQPTHEMILAVHQRLSHTVSLIGDPGLTDELRAHLASLAPDHRELGALYLRCLSSQDHLPVPALDDLRRAADLDRVLEQTGTLADEARTLGAHLLHATDAQLARIARALLAHADARRAVLPVVSPESSRLGTAFAALEALLAQPARRKRPSSAP